MDVPGISDPRLELYLRLFRGREDYFAQQGESWYVPVERALDEFYLLRHLAGDDTYGIYVLNRMSYCHLVCIDIDVPKRELGKIDLSNPREKYDYLKHEIQSVLGALTGSLSVPRNSILLEETGGRGYHIWIFFSRPVRGQTAVNFGEMLKTRLDFSIEFFPKQGQLSAKRKYGNLIKLPLGLHQKYGSLSSFFELSAEGPQAISGVTLGLEHLRTVAPMNPEVFETTVSNYETTLPVREEELVPLGRPEQTRPQFENDATGLISQCTAMRDLRAKAEGGGRFSRSEAFYFADVLLSISDGAEIVHNTLRLSFGADYNRQRTQDEIEKIRPLHPPSCLTLVRNGVCADYCKESVRKRNEDPLVSCTTPCSVWLQRIPAKRKPDVENLVEEIGTPELLPRLAS